MIENVNQIIKVGRQIYFAIAPLHKGGPLNYATQLFHPRDGRIAYEGSFGYLLPYRRGIAFSEAGKDVDILYWSEGKFSNINLVEGSIGISYNSSRSSHNYMVLFQPAVDCSNIFYYYCEDRGLLELPGAYNFLIGDSLLFATDFPNDRLQAIDLDSREEVSFYEAKRPLHRNNKIVLSNEVAAIPFADGGLELFSLTYRRILLALPPVTNNTYTFFDSGKSALFHYYGTGLIKIDLASLRILYDISLLGSNERRLTGPIACNENYIFIGDTINGKVYTYSIETGQYLFSCETPGARIPFGKEVLLYNENYLYVLDSINRAWSFDLSVLEKTTLDV